MQKLNNQKRLNQENHVTHDLSQDFVMHLGPAVQNHD